MAESEFKKLSDQLSDIPTLGRALRKMLDEESPFRAAAAKAYPAVQIAYDEEIPSDTGRAILQVQTPDGPVVFDWVENFDVSDGTLYVRVLHKGNRTVEVFPAGQWTRVTEKRLAPTTDRDRSLLTGEEAQRAAEKMWNE